MKKAKMEIVETYRIMTIFTKSGSVQLQGQAEELHRFKERIKQKENRHTFIEVPAKLYAWNPALEGVTVLPADVGVIIIADPMKSNKLALPKKGLFLPTGQRKMGPEN